MRLPANPQMLTCPTPPAVTALKLDVESVHEVSWVALSCLEDVRNLQSHTDQLLWYFKSVPSGLLITIVSFLAKI